MADIQTHYSCQLQWVKLSYTEFNRSIPGSILTFTDEFNL